jgi:hypothetical protein
MKATIIFILLFGMITMSQAQIEQGSITNPKNKGANFGFQEFKDELEKYKVDSAAAKGLSSCSEYELVWIYSQYNSTYTATKTIYPQFLCDDEHLNNLLNLNNGAQWNYRENYIGNKYVEVIGNASTGSFQQKIYYYQRKIQEEAIQGYSLQYYEIDTSNNIALISLFGSYSVSEDPDSLVVPPAKEYDEDYSIEEKFKEAKYIKLDSSYRERFFEGTKISKTDSVFIYDYATDAMITLAVKNLNTIACLNIYAGYDDFPFSQLDYMIGFEIDKKLLKGISPYYSNSLVYIGKSNPFVRGQMKPVVWKKINSKDFPEREISVEQRNNISIYTKGNTYRYERSGLEFYIQNYLIDSIVSARRLLVIYSKTRVTACERMYYDSEGTSLAPLNLIDENSPNFIDQWSGTLFKNKSPVIFGFLYYSFGCPEITFLNNKDNDLYIGCDNRH